MAIKFRKCAFNSNVLHRIIEIKVSHIVIQFLVPKEHSYRVGCWYNNIKYLSAHTTKDDKYTCVTYIGTRNLYQDDEVDVLERLFDMVHCI